MSPDKELPPPDGARVRALPGSRTPVRRETRVPAKQGAQRPSPPTHAARKLDFVDLPDRDHWWNLLGDAVRRNIEHKVGSRIEWWAYQHAIEKDRPYAVVFGPRGFAVTKPTANNAGRPAHLVEFRRFDPASVRFALVQQQPSTRTAGPAADSESRLSLTEDMAGFLGNLPVEAQLRLQAPFVGDDPPQDYNYYYTGTDERLNVWCYLAGARSVTFASGLRVGRPDAATWQMTCRMATVVPR